MVRRKTIGDNPLDNLIQPTEANEVKIEDCEHTRAPRREQFCSAAPEKSSTNYSTRRQRITVQISAEVIDRIKNAVYWTPGLTLAAFAEQAFEKAVDRLEKEKPFPQRHQELKTGRPLK